MSEEEFNTLIITEDEAGERLDKILANRYQEIQSRTYFQNLIRDQKVLLNGEPVKKRAQPKGYDEVEVCFSLSQEIDITPEDIFIDILYEDQDLLVINKTPGMVVHPAPGNWSGTFVNALIYYCKKLQESPSIRPGIVHRLDKDTSGLLIAAKNSQAQQKLIEMFSSRKIYKEYIAICIGNPGNQVINQPIGRHPKDRKKMTIHQERGRAAITTFKTEAFNEKLSVVTLIPKTGRTHQLRVHMKAFGTPILGDATYGINHLNEKYRVNRQLLHARRLKFEHPITGKKLELDAPIPKDMRKFISSMITPSQSL